MKFERLDPKKHHRKPFDCGVIALNDYLQQFANQDQKRSLARLTTVISRTNFSLHFWLGE